MRSRAAWIAMVVVVAAVAIAAFGAGVVAGAGGVVGVRPQLLTGDGYAGDHVATLTVGGDSYGARSSVPWRDASGSEHDGGWPECLAMGSVAGVHFTGAVVWHGDSGQAMILWVDCSGR